MTNGMPHPFEVFYSEEEGGYFIFVPNGCVLVNGVAATNDDVDNGNLALDFGDAPPQKVYCHVKQEEGEEGEEKSWKFTIDGEEEEEGAKYNVLVATFGQSENDGQSYDVVCSAISLGGAVEGSDYIEVDTAVSAKIETPDIVPSAEDEKHALLTNDTDQLVRSKKTFLGDTYQESQSNKIVIDGPSGELSTSSSDETKKIELDAATGVETITHSEEGHEDKKIVLNPSQIDDSCESRTIEVRKLTVNFPRERTDASEDGTPVSSKTYNILGCGDVVINEGDAIDKFESGTPSQSDGYTITPVTVTLKDGTSLDPFDVSVKNGEDGEDGSQISVDEVSIDKHGADDDDVLQLADFNNSKSDSGKGIERRLRADPETGEITAINSDGLMLVARKNGHIVYIPFSGNGEDPDLPDPTPSDPCNDHPGGGGYVDPSAGGSGGGGYDPSGGGPGGGGVPGDATGDDGHVGPAGCGGSSTPGQYTTGVDPEPGGRRIFVDASALSPESDIHGYASSYNHITVKQ